MGTGSRIERRRNELKLSQEEVASRVRRLGGEIHQTGIDKIEKRDTQRPRFLKEIAIALGVNEDWLLTGREPMERLEAVSVPPPLRVPVVTWVSAGAMARDDGQQDIVGEADVTGLDPRGRWIALRVEGDSMDRISPPGSLIFVNLADRRLVTNACYIITNADGEASYKRFRANPPRFEPVSTNPSHEPIFPDGEPAVLGRVRRSVIEM
jgi:phage repressor protein C with HTH and peptisase S24 domain